MFILKSSDHILISMIRIAGDPVETKDGVQLARSFLESLSDEQSIQLDNIRKNVSPEVFREMVFNAVGSVESEKELMDRRKAEKRKSREDEARLKSNFPADMPIALPEEEHIMLKDEIKNPYLGEGSPVPLQKKDRKPRRKDTIPLRVTPKTDHLGTSPTEVDMDLKLTNQNSPRENWWGNFNK